MGGFRKHIHMFSEISYVILTFGEFLIYFYYNFIIAKLSQNDLGSGLVPHTEASLGLTVHRWYWRLRTRRIILGRKARDIR